MVTINNANIKADELRSKPGAANWIRWNLMVPAKARKKTHPSNTAWTVPELDLMRRFNLATWHQSMQRDLRNGGSRVDHAGAMLQQRYRGDFAEIRMDPRSARQEESAANNGQHRRYC